MLPCRHLLPETLRAIGIASATVPGDFGIHPRLKTIFKRKIETLQAGKELDWSVLLVAFEDLASWLLQRRPPI